MGGARPGAGQGDAAGTSHIVERHSTFHAGCCAVLYIPQDAAPPNQTRMHTPRGLTRTGDRGATARRLDLRPPSSRSTSSRASGCHRAGRVSCKRLTKAPHLVTAAAACTHTHRGTHRGTHREVREATATASQVNGAGGKIARCHAPDSRQNRRPGGTTRRQYSTLPPLPAQPAADISLVGCQLQGRQLAKHSEIHLSRQLRHTHFVFNMCKHGRTVWGPPCCFKDTFHVDRFLTSAAVPSQRSTGGMVLAAAEAGPTWLERQISQASQGCRPKRQTAHLVRNEPLGAAQQVPRQPAPQVLLCFSTLHAAPHASKQVWGLERQAGDALSLK